MRRCVDIRVYVRISTQLYANITHFVLELIQNADDNSYDRSKTPSLCVELSRHRLIVKCNEVGFTPENVQAICDINASTKKKNKQLDDGFIGEKGIGNNLSTNLMVNC